MKPSASPPYDGAPAAWVAASAVPNDAAASADTLPGSTQRRIRHPSSTPRTSGTGTPPSAAASPSQRSPEASAAKKPAGGGAWVFMIAVVPSESRSLVAEEVSPPASGAVATTAAPRSSSACLATRGWRVMCVRGSRAGTGFAEAGQLLEGGDEDGTRPFHHRQHLLEALRPTVVRVRDLASRFDGVVVTEQPDPLGIRLTIRRRCDATHVGQVACVHGEHQVVSGQPGLRELLRAMRGRVVVVGAQDRGCTLVHRVAEMPVAGAAARDGHPAGQAGVVHALGQDDVGHGGAADVAQADQRDGVVPGRARSRYRRTQRVSPITLSRIQVTTVMTIAPPTAGQKPSTWKPMSSLSASQLVNLSIAALITTRNSPSVTTINGIDRKVSTGFTNDVTTPRISATSSSGTSLCLISSPPCTGPLK